MGAGKGPSPFFAWTGWAEKGQALLLRAAREPEKGQALLAIAAGAEKCRVGEHARGEERKRKRDPFPRAGEEDIEPQRARQIRRNGIEPHRERLRDVRPIFPQQHDRRTLPDEPQQDLHLDQRADQLSQADAYVDTDNVAGGRMATEVLIERGCTRIGTIAGPADMTAGQDRLQGWKSAMREGGLADKAVEHGDFTEAGGELAARALLERHPRLDGIFVASDLMGSGTLRVLAATGRRVPDDVAVVGYDDLGVAERTTPPLTTVVQPIVEMAEQATRTAAATGRRGTVRREPCG